MRLYTLGQFLDRGGEKHSAKLYGIGGTISVLLFIPMPPVALGMLIFLIGDYLAPPVEKAIDDAFPIGLLPPAAERPAIAPADEPKDEFDSEESEDDYEPVPPAAVSRNLADDFADSLEAIAPPPRQKRKRKARSRQRGPKLWRLTLKDFEAYLGKDHLQLDPFKLTPDTPKYSAREEVQFIQETESWCNKLKGGDDLKKQADKIAYALFGSLPRNGIREDVIEWIEELVEEFNELGHIEAPKDLLESRQSEIDTALAPVAANTKAENTPEPIAVSPGESSPPEKQAEWGELDLDFAPLS